MPHPYTPETLTPKPDAYSKKNNPPTVAKGCRLDHG